MKKCSSCKILKLPSEFGKNRSKKDGLQTKCKSCNKEDCKRHYVKNKEYHLEKAHQRNVKHRKVLQNFVYDYLSKNHCVDCGENDIRCLEFDHVRHNKSANISTIIREFRPLSLLETEIAKCDVRCANCHRKRTSDVQGWYKSGV